MSNTIIVRSRGCIVGCTLTLFNVVVLRLLLGLADGDVSREYHNHLSVAFGRCVLRRIVGGSCSTISTCRANRLRGEVFGSISIVSSNVANVIPSYTFCIIGLIYTFVCLIIVSGVFTLIFLYNNVFIFVYLALFEGPLGGLRGEIRRARNAAHSFFRRTVVGLLIIGSFSTRSGFTSRTGRLRRMGCGTEVGHHFIAVTSGNNVSAIFGLNCMFTLNFNKLHLLNVNNAVACNAMATVLRLIGRIRNPFTGLSAALPGCCSVVTSTRELVRVTDLPSRFRSGDTSVSIRGACRGLGSVGFGSVAFGCSHSLVLSGASLGVGGNSFITVANVSNVNGDALLGLLLNIFHIGNNGVRLTLRGNALPISGRAEGLFSCIPRNGVLLSNAVESGLAFVGRGTARDRVSRTIHVSYTSRFVGRLPRNLRAIVNRGKVKLSRKRIRELTVTHSVLSSSPVLLLSRTASTLSRGARGGFLAGLGRLGSIAYVVIDRGETTLRVYGGCIHVRGSGVVDRRGSCIG